MRILFKIPLVLAGIIAAWFVAFFVVRQVFVQPRFDTLERDAALRDLDRVMAAVSRESQQLALLDREWGAWDDAYRFVAGEYPQFREALEPGSVRSSRADVIAIYSTDGTLLYEAGYDWTTSRTRPETLFPQKAPPGAPWLLPAVQVDNFTGFLSTRRGVFQIASTQILHTDGTGPARGSFIMGRLIDDTLAARIAEQTSVHTRLFPANLAGSLDVPAIVAQDGRSIRMRGATEDILAYGVIQDIAGSPALVVETSSPRDAGRWARDTLRISEGMIQVLGLCLFGILLLLLLRLVVRPLTAIQAYVRRFEVEEDAPMPPSLIARRDELGGLAMAFRHLGVTLAAKRHELLASKESLEGRIEERTRALSKANDDLRLMAQVVESTAEAIVITDLQGNIVKVNNAFCVISGYEEGELAGRTPRIIKSDRHEPAFYRQMWEQLTRDGVWSGEIWDRRKNGEIYPTVMTINLIRDEAGAPEFYVGVATDISHAKMAEERLHELAYFDPLTSLPNRTLFQDRLDRSLLHGQREGFRVALLYVDLDNFKHVNNAMGHTAGDLLLVEVAARISRRVRRSDTVCRLGGDEFAVILDQLRKSEDAGTVAQSIIDELTRAFVISGREVFVGASIGIAVYPYDELTSGGLTRMADAAMYQAKQAGRNGFRFVSGQTNERSQARLAMEADLRRALERNELILFYQPLVALDSGKVLGAEALVRWRRAGEEALVSPGQFIPLAEETGIILPIGAWALAEACRTAASWNAQGHPIPVSVNVSPRQFAHRGLVGEVRAALSESGLLPHLLTIEITESSLIGDVAGAQRTMTELKEIGVKIAIDDFGTGYSSLSYLSRFPVDRLKIDQSFVRGIGTAGHADALVNAIISMGEGLGLGILAEGVETEAQRHFLRERGCAEAQGYLFSKPVPLDDFMAYVRDRKSARTDPA